jgi:hypothetical protein
MNKEFMKAEFVAEAVTARMRDGDGPKGYVAGYLDCIPLIDSLRQNVTKDDVPGLIKVTKEQQGQTAGLAVSLLRRYVNEPKVKDCLTERWATADPYLKNRIMWRLLDDPNLPQEWHRRIYEFITAEWGTFSEFNRSFFGEGKVGVLNLLARIGDPSFPATKKWVYLCCVPVVIDNRDAAKGVLTLCQALDDTFAREVAEDLMRRSLPGETADLQRIIAGNKAGDAEALNYIAEAIVSYLRASHRPSDEDADSLNQIPIIDVLRSRVAEADLSWLLSAIESETGPIAALYLSLLKQFDTRSDVKDALKHRWETADAYLRAHLMWRILDDPDLPEEWHQRIFEFVMAEWSVFSSVVRKFMGSPKTVIPNVLRRMADPSYPDTKKWVNFCRLPEIADDQESAKAIVQLGCMMPAPFTREVAGALMGRFYSAH